MSPMWSGGRRLFMIWIIVAPVVPFGCSLEVDEFRAADAGATDAAMTTKQDAAASASSSAPTCSGGGGKLRYCPGFGCVDVTKPDHCGDCETRCGPMQECKDTGCRSKD
jgi:hypothetical protein